jgi:hypothetical protein
MGLSPEILGLLADQDGVVSRRRVLEGGLAPNDVRRMVRRREWVAVHPGIYVDHTGPLTWRQRAWAAVLHAWPASLCDLSALRIVDGPGRHPDDLIHVAIDVSRRVADRPGVRVHRMAHAIERTAWNLSPPRLRYDEAALDVAAAAPSDFAALGLIAQVCAGRRTTAVRLAEALARRARSPRRDWLAAVLADVADGACSVLEHGYLHRVERAHQLPRAERQERATATLGVVYRDATYNELYLELDGRLYHDTAAQRDRDLDRDLDAAVERRTTIRLGYGQVYARPCAAAARVAVLLRHRGWTDTSVACGPDCQVLSGWSPDANM